MVRDGLRCSLIREGNNQCLMIVLALPLFVTLILNNLKQEEDEWRDGFAGGGGEGWSSGSFI